MGDGLSAQHCKNRWNIYLKHWQKGLKSANWQPDEVPHPTTVLTYTQSLTFLLPCIQVKRLLELAPQHSTQKGTDWTAIGNELGRAPMDCLSKYRLIQYSKMNKGHFSAEEDALIRQRVEEWGDKGDGLWVALEEEMDRPGNYIRARWLILHDTNTTFWTDEMVCISVIAYYEVHIWIINYDTLILCGT